jgi:hypothetical protein
MRQMKQRHLMHCLQESVNVEEVANTIYIGTATWASEDQVGDCSFQFEVSTTTNNIKQARKSIRYPDDFNPAGDGQVIGQTMKNGKLEEEGTEILIPEAGFSITKTFDEGDILPAFRTALIDLVGSINDDTVTLMGQEFAEGSLLFKGASGGLSAENEFEITFSFAYSPNSDDIRGELGLGAAFVDAIPKEGWQYAEINYKTTDEEINPGVSYKLKKEADTVQVHDVYPKQDFSQLAICEE